MDAKYAKLASGVAVVLLLASVFTFPAAQAQNVDPTSAPNVVFDGRGVATTCGAGVGWTRLEPYGNKCITIADTSTSLPFLVTATDSTAGPIVYNSSYDVTVTNLTSTLNEVWTLGIPGGGPIATAQAGIDGRHTGKFNITFSADQIGRIAPVSGKFDQVGQWELRRAGTLTGYILVNATGNLKVTLSQASFTYSGNQIAVAITVTDSSTGAAVSGARLRIYRTDGVTLATEADADGELTPSTGASGTFTWTPTTPPVGKFIITATKNAPAPADGNPPEFRGTANFEVTAAPLIATAVKTDVLRGFQGFVEYNVTIGGRPLFARAGTATTTPTGLTFDAEVANYRVNISVPASTACFARFVGTTTGQPTLEYTNCADGGRLYILWSNTNLGARGNLRYYANNTVIDSAWLTGTYSMKVEVNAKDTTVIGTTGVALEGTGKPEYTTSVSWVPGAPADINIDISPSKMDVSARTGHNTPPAAGGLPAPQAITLVITGSKLSQHPTGKFGTNCVLPTAAQCWDAFVAATNLTISGDILKIVDSDGTQRAPNIGAYNPVTGVVTITDVYPTKGLGKISIGVKWKNTTTTKDVQIVRGGQIAGDKAEIVVDTTSAITFTLKGSSGAPDAFGRVEITHVVDGTGAIVTQAITSGTKALSGNGTTGLGLDGKYTFNLKETRLGTYIVYGIVGQGTAGQNYTYTTFRVVPAHDLKTRIVKGANCLAGLDCAISVNVTKATGLTYNRTGELPQFFLLNSGQAKNFLQNGSLPAYTAPPLPAGSLVPALFPVSSSIVNQITSYNFTVGGGMGLAPDTYYLYVRDFNAKHDNFVSNLSSLPQVKVHHAKATFSPTAVVNNPNVQKDETITVTVVDGEGKLINGTLILDNRTTMDPASTGSLSFKATGNANVTNALGSPGNTRIKVTNGKATFIVTGYGKAGSVKFDFDPKTQASAGPADAAGIYDVLGTLEVVGAAVDVTPSRIPVGAPSSLVIKVTDLKGKALPNLPTQVCGAPIGGTNVCTGNQSTDGQGIARVGVSPFATGNLTLRINGTDASKTVVVFAGLVVAIDPAAPKVNDLVAISITQPGGRPESDVNVKITDAAGATVKEQTTDATGKVTWTPTKEGTYRLTAAKAGFETETRTIVVGAAPATPKPTAAKFTVSDLTVSPQKVTVGSASTVRVKVTNTGDAAGEARVNLLVDGAIFDSKSVALEPGQSATVAFSFQPNSAKDYQIQASVGSSETSPTTVTASAAPTQGPTQGPTGGTGGTTPTGVPGFGIGALVAALAVAMMLVRRRK